MLKNFCLPLQAERVITGLWCQRPHFRYKSFLEFKTSHIYPICFLLRTLGIFFDLTYVWFNWSLWSWRVWWFDCLCIAKIWQCRDRTNENNFIRGTVATIVSIKSVSKINSLFLFLAFWEHCLPNRWDWIKQNKFSPFVAWEKQSSHSRSRRRCTWGRRDPSTSASPSRAHWC